MNVHLKRRDGTALTVHLRRDGDVWHLADGVETREVVLLECTNDRLVFEIDGRVQRAYASVTGRDVRVVLGGRESIFARQEPASPGHTAHGADLREPVLRAPVPGRVLRVPVEPDTTVQAGDVLVVIEAMKMESPVVAPADGVVREVHVADGELVDQDQPLVTCEYPE